MSSNETNGSLQNASENDGQVMPKSSDDEDRKLFLGGLSWETNEDDIRGHFGKYGTVEDVSIKYDAMTGNPRGFGFITFKEDNAIDKVLANMPHSLKNKTIDPKRAKSRPICKKIFVGGLDSNVTEEEIRKYFGRYGKVEGIELPFDRQRGRRREFCFIIFESEEGADAATKEAKQKIGGRECDIKKAQPQPVAQQQKRMQQSTGYGGGGGYYSGGNYGGDDDGFGYGGRKKRGGGGSGGGGGGSSQYAGYGNGYSGYGNYYGNYNYGGYNQQGYEGYYSQGYPYGYDYWGQYGYGGPGYGGDAASGEYGQPEAGTPTYGTGVSGAAGQGQVAGGGTGKAPGRKPGNQAPGYHPYRTAASSH